MTSRNIERAPYDQLRHDYRLAHGRAPRICRWCGGPLPKRRRRWCSEECSHEFAIRSDPGYARLQVAARDHGVCASCGLDMQAVAASINRQVRRHGRKGEWVGRIAVALRIAHRSYWASQPRGGDPMRISDARRRMGQEKYRAWVVREIRYLPGFSSNALWDMDHITPVCEGGGGCGLDGLQTLCIWCHRRETKKLQGRLARRRADAWGL